MKKKNSYKKAFMEIETASFMKELAGDLKEKAVENGAMAEFSLDISLPGRLRFDAAFLRESFLTIFPHCAENSKEERSIFFVRGEGLEEGRYVLQISVSEGGEGFTKEELELLNVKKDNCPSPYLSRLFAIKKGAKERAGDFFVCSTAGGGAVYYMILPCESLTSVTVGELEKEKEGLHNVEHEVGKIDEQQLEHKWIDRELALNYAGDMEEMRLELLGIYFEQAQQYLKELPKLVEAEDWEKYRITVHAIKGNSLGIGAESFSKEAYEQEMAAKDGDVEKIKAEFQNFYSHYRSLVEEVKNSKL